MAQKSYLGAYKRAAEDQCGSVQDYFELMVVMDNFAGGWAYGYSQRFGLVYTDYNTQKPFRSEGFRIFLTKMIIETNGESVILPEVAHGKSEAERKV